MQLFHVTFLVIELANGGETKLRNTSWSAPALGTNAPYFSYFSRPLDGSQPTGAGQCPNVTDDCGLTPIFALERGCDSMRAVQEWNDRSALEIQLEVNDLP